MEILTFDRNNDTYFSSEILGNEVVSLYKHGTYHLVVNDVFVYSGYFAVQWMFQKAYEILINNLPKLDKQNIIFLGKELYGHFYILQTKIDLKLDHETQDINNLFWVTQT